MDPPLPSFKLALPLSLVALALVATPARAEVGWHGSVAATSRYVFRGLMLRGDAPALQADLHWRSEAEPFTDLAAVENAFAGVWLSSGPARRGFYGRHEVNLYAGLGFRAMDRWALALRVVHYAYPDSRLGRRYDYDELAVTATFDDRLAVSLSASPNTTLFSSQGLVERRPTRAFEVSLRQGLPGPLSLVAAAGYYDTEALFGTAYRAWNVGLAARLGAVELSLARFGTDAHARRLFRASAADGLWALSAAWSF
jgi:uncharacterized protein (TIGR02001 family)